MGQLVVTEFITLDGVAEDPGGAEGSPFGGWAFKFDRGEEGTRFKVAELEAADAQLLGRVTYEGFAKAWPEMKGMGEFGVRMNEMPKFVYSRTLESPTWRNSRVVGGDLAEVVLDLRQRHDGNILVAGSLTLVRALLAADLVDELNLMVFPIVVGGGKRLFGDLAESRRFHVVESRRTGGVTITTLRRERHHRRLVDVPGE